MSLLDRFLSKPRPRRPHLINSITYECEMCGVSGWDLYDSPECDPTSDKAKKYRREKRDAAVGQIARRGIR